MEGNSSNANRIPDDKLYSCITSPTKVLVSYRIRRSFTLTVLNTLKTYLKVGFRLCYDPYITCMRTGITIIVLIHICV